MKKEVKMTVFGGLFFLQSYSTCTSDFHSVQVTPDISIGQALARLVFLVIIEVQEASVKQQI